MGPCTPAQTVKGLFERDKRVDVQQAATVGILKLSSKFKVYLIKLCFAYKVLNSAAFPVPVAKYIHHFQKPQNFC